MTEAHLLDLGLVDYQHAWDMQNALAARVAAGTHPPTLMLLEHPHTVTFGRRGQSANLLWSEAELARRGVSVYWVDRGGDVTYHGPGQLVGYPIMKISGDHVGYIRRLEDMLIRALARLGLPAGQLSGHTGVWVQADVYSRCAHCRPQDRHKPAKIAAIGVKVDAQGVTRHGFALNVAPDMSYFEGIIPCGLAEYPVTSLADFFDPPPSMARVRQAVIATFGEVFGWRFSDAAAHHLQL
ncbi:MAG: lipoyl(octanoyl) transferase LipB [Anaerolineales bacterium]